MILKHVVSIYRSSLRDWQSDSSWSIRIIVRVLAHTHVSAYYRPRRASGEKRCMSFLFDFF